MRFILYILFCIKRKTFQNILSIYLKNNNLEKNKQTRINLKHLKNIDIDLEEKDNTLYNNTNIAKINLHINYKKTLDILNNNDINNFVKIKYINDLKYFNDDNIISDMIFDLKKGGLFNDWLNN